MPVYCFRCPDCGKVTERTCDMAARPQVVRCRCGSDASRDFASERHCTSAPGAWPMVSRALGVPRTKVDEMRRKYPHHVYRDDGAMVLADRSQRRQVLRDLGYADHDGGYSD